MYIERKDQKKIPKHLRSKIVKFQTIDLKAWGSKLGPDIYGKYIGKIH